MRLMLDSGVLHALYRTGRTCYGTAFAKEASSVVPPIFQLGKDKAQYLAACFLILPV